MKIHFLHGWQSTPDGVKPTYLKSHGHEVLNPALPDDDFDAAVRIAQAAFDQGKPDVVVGSSRGGAVTMNLKTGSTPLVLLCPAWKRWGTATTVKPGTVILHSRADATVPFADSEELVRNSGLPSEALVEVGTEHRLADPESLKAMLRACEQVNKQSASDPVELLESLRGRASSGEFRLFAVACCRRIWHHLNPKCRAAVKVGQQFAEGLADDHRRKDAYTVVNEQCIYVDDASSAQDRFDGFAAEAAANCLFGDDDYPPIPTYATTCAIAAAGAVVEVVGADCEIRGQTEPDCLEAVSNERRWQCETIKDMFGPWFLDPSQEETDSE